MTVQTSENRRRVVVACDFDGTITQEDLGLATMGRFATGDWWAIETAWRDGEISSMECLQRQFAMVEASEEELHAFYQSVPIDEAFVPFVQACRAAGVDVAVLSDGLDFYIEIVLRRVGLADLPYVANHLRFENGEMVIEFPHQAADCSKCGNCKRDHARRLAGEYDVVAFVGDGHSDRCVAGHADPVFAKSHLREYCQSERIPFTPFETFADLLSVPRQWAD